MATALIIEGICFLCSRIRVQRAANRGSACMFSDLRFSRESTGKWLPKLHQSGAADVESRTYVVNFEDEDRSRVNSRYEVLSQDRPEVTRPRVSARVKRFKVSSTPAPAGSSQTGAPARSGCSGSPHLLYCCQSRTTTEHVLTAKPVLIQASNRTQIKSVNQDSKSMATYVSPRS